MIGLVVDTRTKWHVRFADELESRDVEYKKIIIESGNWFVQIKECDHIIWRPNLSEPFLTEAREKIFFISRILCRKVYPSVESFWHYDKKICQAYLMRYYEIRTPDTGIFYLYDEALQYIENCTYPIISKSSGGAASRNVRMLKNFKQARSELNWIFSKTLVSRLVDKILGQINLARNRYDGQKKYVYYQEMIEGNAWDYRITTIGDNIAFSFIRKNRENDFRASGSGLIEYDIDHNHEVIKYCLDISRKMEFDTMCYDVLFRDDKFYIVEFSYTFSDTAIYNCPGYFLRKEDKLEWVEGHVWPQTLIIDYLCGKWGL